MQVDKTEQRFVYLPYQTQVSEVYYQLQNKIYYELAKKIQSIYCSGIFSYFFFGASLTSCSKKAEEKEGAEHPTEEKAEHPKADSVQEHPSKDRLC